MCGFDSFEKDLVRAIISPQPTNMLCQTIRNTNTIRFICYAQAKVDGIAGSASSYNRRLSLAIDEEEEEEYNNNKNG